MVAPIIIFHSEKVLAGLHIALRRYNVFHGDLHRTTGRNSMWWMEPFPRKIEKVQSRLWSEIPQDMFSPHGRGGSSVGVGETHDPPLNRESPEHPHWITIDSRKEGIGGRVGG
ncbi:Os01g0667750 [Oryza sativa Japonica Group]|uniref:Os01g0667750 protein n=1 Tax=Oryza sativa subsp. japonica TaxID=39947 RepID=A0A0P0V6B1_ORYSJ|nr:hypothetical protein EE612_004869 [Oryza sativa]BAS73595.1 Os01g0667750 [Oryza sativa Japonica Group]